MIVLGFDTATPATAVGLRLADGTTLRAYDQPEAGERPGHTTQSLTLASELLAQAGIGWGALERIAVGVGPGTFTGLRVGIATARGLAQSLGIEVVGVSSLRVLAQAALREPDSQTRRGVLAAIDARRGEAFAAAYDAQGELAPPRALPPEDLAAILGKLEAERASPRSASPVRPARLVGGRRRSATLSGISGGDRGGGPSGHLAASPSRRRGAVRAGPERAGGRSRGGAARLPPPAGCGDLLGKQRKQEVSTPLIADVAAEQPHLEIRRLAYPDLPQVIGIERRAFPTPWSLAMFVLELSKPSGICLAAVLDTGGSRRLVGYMICSRYETVWHVMNVAVAPEHRREGVASALLGELYERVDDEQARYTLEVRRSNDVAIRLYEREGFRAAGMRRRYYQDNGEDALVMWRTPATLVGSLEDVPNPGFL